MSKKEKIKALNEGDWWICPCKNDTMDIGFATCDTEGNFLEPLLNLWTGLYACQRCGRIIDQNTFEIIGRNENFISYDSANK